MSFTATLPEGRAIRDSIECIEGAHVPENIFGVLRFALDVNNIPFRDLDDFFDDFRNVDNAELYGRLLNEFPNWLKAARSKNIIR